MRQVMDNALISLLKDMTQHCRGLQRLLKNDQNQIRMNNTTTLPDSNQQKSQLLDKFNDLASQLNVLKDKAELEPDFLAQIEKMAANADVALRQHAIEVVTEFKRELATCYQTILVNNNIVTANLQNLKNIWDKIMASQLEQSNIYDHTGNAVT